MELVLFDTDPRLGARLAETGASVILVQPGPIFQRLGDDHFTLNPADHAGYSALIADLHEQGRLPHAFVSLWSERVAAAENPAAEYLDHTVYPLFALSQALIHCKVTTPVRLLYCYAAMPGPLSPFIQGLSGFVRTLRMEHPNYCFQLLALDGGAALDRAALAAAITRECAKAAPADLELRYVAGQRYARRFRPVAAEPADPRRLPIKAGGCYVIAGGGGALGGIFARYLAGQAPLRLVLIGRSPLKDSSLLAELERAGSQAVYLQVDITDQAALHAALAPFGPVQGVIQAAGATADGLLMGKSKASFEQTIAAKVQGTLALDAVTRTQPLDFFVLFASSSGAFGNVGQADYAYANSFLNGFAEERSRLVAAGARHGQTIAINWPLWADGGMGHDQATRARLAALGLQPLATDQGLRAFEASMQASLSQLVVLTGDAARIAVLVEPSPEPSPAPAAALAESDTAPMIDTPPPGDPDLPQVPAAETSVDELLHRRTIDYLRGLLSGATGLAASRIDPLEPLESYGVDSVMIMDLNSQLAQRFGELPKTLFFEYQTLDQLASYFVEQHRPAVLIHIGSPAAPSAQPSPAAPPAAPSVSAPAARAAPASLEPSVDEDVAIIGVSGRYPMAANLEEFWHNLQTGRNCVTTIPAERWDYRRYFHPEKGTYGKTYSIWGGFLDNIDKFDPLFFNISPLEAEMLDPQERLFIQTVWHTLEDAGYTRAALNRDHVGVYVGVMWGQYQLYGAVEPDDGVILTPASSYASIANRVSYFFNFRGPSIALDTMCSSSLTTIHLACESIRRGEIEVAIAGGVNLTLHPNKHIFLSQTKFASSEGLCRSFGDGGDGYVPSEGVGAIMLKSLRQAERDGDRIYGVIKATAVNHGGKTNGYTVPNPRQQEDLIRRALRKAAIDPRSISYIEAHGTGTALGDPIEITGLTKAFNLPGDARQVVAVGSVKSNIGHCESAAGIAGITKVLLQMQHRQLVPSIHAETLSTNINFADSPFYIQRALTEWSRPEWTGPRRAGVSSFGAGGANAHIVLEEYVAAPAPVDDNQPQLIVLSARNGDRLRAYAASLADYLGCGGRPSQGLAGDGNALSAAPTQRELTTLVAAALNVDPADLDAGEPLHEYGLDPTGAALLRKRIETAYGLAIAAGFKIDGCSVETLAAHLAGEHGPSAGADSATIPARPRLADVAYTLQVGREAMESRAAFVVATLDELVERLDAFAAGKEHIPGCYVTPARESNGAIDALIEGQEGELFLRSVIERRNLDKLAVLWTARAEIDWRLLSGPATPRRIALPGYPFAQERVWIPESIATPHPPRRTLHPLIDQVVPQLSLQAGLTLSKRIAATDQWLEDYRVDGEAQLPAAALLAMIHAAAGIALPDSAVEYSEISLPPPFAHPDELLIRLQQGADGALVTTIAPAHGTDALTATIRPSAPPAEQRLDLAPIFARCAVQHDLGDSSGPLTFGPAYAGLRSVAWNDQEAIGRYAIDRSQSQLAAHGVVAAQVAAALRLALHHRQSLGLPTGFNHLASLQISGPLPAEGVVYLRRTGDSNHLAILDGAGRVCAKLQGLACRAAQGLPAASAQILERFFYAPRWLAAPGLPAQAPASRKAVVIATAEGQALADALCAGPHAAANLIWLDSATRHPTATTWPVRSDDPQGFAHALEAIGAIDTIYFLGGLETAPADLSLERFEQQQDRGVVALFRLLKALHDQQRLDGDITLKVVTANACQVERGDGIRPFAASLFGLAKSAAREYRRLRIACVDIDAADLEAGRLPALVKRLRGEEPLPTVKEVALRAGERYQQILEPTKLPPAPSGLPAFRSGGAYMVLGGAGNVGFKLCSYLAETAQAQVAIVGRREANPAIAAQLEALRALGGEAMYVAADMSDLESMRRAIVQVKERFGALHGVIHSAMSFEYTPLAALDEARLRQDLAPKARGSVALHHALAGEPLDFLLYFSSGEAFTGNIGWGSYAAGCTFEDAFARATSGAAYPVQVINWGFWESERSEYLDALKAKGVYPIDTATGMEAVSRVVAAGVPQVMALNVADKVLELMGVVLPAATVPAAAAQARSAATPAPSGPPAAQKSAAADPLARLHGYIRQHFATVLKIAPERIGDDELSNYGVDSLVVTDIHKRFEHDLGSMPVTLLLENTTVAAIGAFLQRDYPDRLAAFFADGAAPAAPVADAAATVDDLFATAPAADQPIAAEPVTPAVAQPDSAPSPIRLLRQIEPAAIAEELRRYGDQYAEKAFPRWKQAGGPAISLAELDAAPQALKHLLVRTTGDAEVEVWVAGTGAPLVLIPAIGLTAPVWINQIQRWSAEFRVIVIHQQGYGMTDLLGDISTDAVARLFVETLEHLGIDRPCHVIGSCFGGVAAQYIAQAYPEKVCSLTLCGTFNKNFGLPDIDVSELTIDQMIEGAKMIGASINRDFDAVIAGLPDKAALPEVEDARGLLIKSQCVNPLVVMRYITQILTLNGQAWLPRIQAPTLCLSGDLDTIVAPETSVTISQQIPAGRYIEIPGSGHYPFLTHIDLFEGAVKPFLRQQEEALAATVA